MKDKKTILVVEDELLLQLNFKSLKPENVNLLQARTCQQAREIFERNKGNIDIIAFDGKIRPQDDIMSDEIVDPEDMTTIELIRNIRKEFSGIMIAMSSDNDIIKQQMEAGCDLRLDEKMELFDFIAKYEKLKREVIL